MSVHQEEDEEEDKLSIIDKEWILTLNGLNKENHLDN